MLLARLQLLETENARLRATATAPPPAAPVAPRPRRKVGRSTAAVVLILIGALLAPVAVVGSWARGLVVDTERYVDTVAPIAQDPLVQSAVANRITLAVVDALNVEQLTTQATDAVAGLDLPPLVGQAVTSLQAPLQEAITGFIRKNVTKIVSSDAFENVWEEANRAAHEQIVATLRGDPDALAQISDTGALTIDVTPIIEDVKTSLEQAGFSLVSRIPTVNVTFPIASSADLVRLQSAYRLIDVVGGLLPYLSLALLGAGVLAAQHRSRALVVAGLSLAGRDAAPRPRADDRQVAVRELAATHRATRGHRRLDLRPGRLAPAHRAAGRPGARAAPGDRRVRRGRHHGGPAAARVVVPRLRVAAFRRGPAGDRHGAGRCLARPAAHARARRGDLAGCARARPGGPAHPGVRGRGVRRRARSCSAS